MVLWLLQQLNLSFKTFTQRNYQVRVALPENLTKTSEKVLQNVLLFYCCETNCHKYSNLKQHTLIISHCPWLRSPAQLGGLCSPFHKAVIRESAGLWAHRWSAGGGSASGFLQVIDRIHLLTGVGLRSPFSFCVSHSSRTHGPLHRQFASSTLAGKPFSSVC